MQLNRLCNNKYLQHTFFWGLSFLVLANAQKISIELKRIDLIYTAIFHLPILIAVYINLQLLFPCFLEKGKYLLYTLTLSLLIAFGAVFYLILFDNWVDHILKGYYFIAYYGFRDISIFLISYISLTSLLHLARGWFKLQKIQAEQNKAELKALQSQINPHFLFNSLNSIYSLSLKDSPETPEKIIQLSDLLRHAIYECDSDFISLEKEISMLKNYIDLQNLRTLKKNQIQIKITGDIKNKKIAPMLILPFVENSYKHGIKSGAENAFVKIEINIAGNRLNILIQNNKGKSVSSTLEHKGIGIKNVKKRLVLLYPKKHELKISETEQTFKVYLQLEMGKESGIKN